MWNLRLHRGLIPKTVDQRVILNNYLKTLRIDCKAAKHVLKKDVQNIASKQIFARWQAILS